MSQIKKLLTEKQKLMLGYKGYLYTVERQHEERISFRCKNRQCKGKFNKTNFIHLCHLLGRCQTDPGLNTILSEPTEHCHEPIIDQLRVVELKKQDQVLSSYQRRANK